MYEGSQYDYRSVQDAMKRRKIADRLDKNLKGSVIEKDIQNSRKVVENS